MEGGGDGRWRLVAMDEEFVQKALLRKDEEEKKMSGAALACKPLFLNKLIQP